MHVRVRAHARSVHVFDAGLHVVERVKHGAPRCVRHDSGLWWTRAGARSCGCFVYFMLFVR